MLLSQLHNHGEMYRMDDLSQTVELSNCLFFGCLNPKSGSF
jgi:hypothetical protein